MAVQELKCCGPRVISFASYQRTCSKGSTQEVVCLNDGRIPILKRLFIPSKWYMCTCKYIVIFYCAHLTVGESKGKEIRLGRARFTWRRRQTSADAKSNLLFFSQLLVDRRLSTSFYKDVCTPFYQIYNLYNISIVEVCTMATVDEDLRRRLVQSMGRDLAWPTESVGELNPSHRDSSLQTHEIHRSYP